MKNKLILMYLFLVLMIAISLSTVSATDATISDTSDTINPLSEYSVPVSDDTLPLQYMEIDDSLKDTTVNNTGDDVADIQNAIDSVESGDTIYLSNRNYTIGTSQINITKNLTIIGNNTIITGTQNKTGCIFYISAGGGLTPNGLVLKDIIFENSAENASHPAYGNDMYLQGWAVHLVSSKSITIENCSFLNFNQGIHMDSSSEVRVENCYFNGTATKVTNSGSGESGTKAISTKGCNNFTFVNNTFEGPVLDGISVASGSGYNCLIADNLFLSNAYAIYFGGASSARVENNTFIDCGHFIREDSNVSFTNLPIISSEKAASNTLIVGNTFIVRDGNLVLALQAGNTSHGYPSPIGNVNISNNTISLLNNSVNPKTITFIDLLSQEGQVNPFAPIIITNNTLVSGMKVLSYWIKDWGDKYGNITINSAESIKTVITVEHISTSEGYITISLKDINGEVGTDTQSLTGSNISYTKTYANGSSEEGSLTVDSEGKAILDEINDDVYIEFKYDGSDAYANSSAVLNFTVTNKVKTNTTLIFENMTTSAIYVDRTGEYFVASLIDSDGNPLINKTVQIGFNGATYSRTTDRNGSFRLQVNLKVAGGYTFAICFLGDDDYNSSFGVAKITVEKAETKLTNVKSKYTYKSSATSKSIVATLKLNNGTAISKKTVTFTVNGKTYSATTNTKGVATVKVSITAKKTYKYTVKFVATSQLAASSTTGTLVIN